MPWTIDAWLLWSEHLFNSIFKIRLCPFVSEVVCHTKHQPSFVHSHTAFLKSYSISPPQIMTVTGFKFEPIPHSLSFPSGYWKWPFLVQSCSWWNFYAKSLIFRSHPYHLSLCSLLPFMILFKLLCVLQDMISSVSSTVSMDSHHQDYQYLPVANHLFRTCHELGAGVKGFTNVMASHPLLTQIPHFSDEN